MRGTDAKIAAKDLVHFASSNRNIQEEYLFPPHPHHEFPGEYCFINALDYLGRRMSPRSLQGFAGHETPSPNIVSSGNSLGVRRSCGTIDQPLSLLGLGD